VTGLSPGGLEWLAVGGLLTVAGALIRFRGWTFLLAGYDGTAPVPDDVVREVAGNTVLRVGIPVLAVGVLAAVTTPPSYLGPLVGAAVVLDVLRMIYRVRTWSPRAACEAAGDPTAGLRRGTREAAFETSPGSLSRDGRGGTVGGVPPGSCGHAVRPRGSIKRGFEPPVAPFSPGTYATMPADPLSARPPRNRALPHAARSPES